MTPHLAPPGDAGKPARADRPRRDSSDARSTALEWEWVAILAALSAVFAAMTAAISTVPPERLWGMLAACGYGLGALTAITVRHRRAWPAVLVSLAGALLAPLGWMASAGIQQPDVTVVIRSAMLFLHRGTPYQSAAALAAAHTPYAYDPYLPVITLFGIPRALYGGVFTDPRIWFGVVFMITFGAALRIAGVARPVWWTVAVSASPVVAFPLSVGGDDLPVLALECLGLALLGRGLRGYRPLPVTAGLVFGVATAMKATAWPALAVALVLVATRYGRRATAWFSVTAFVIAGTAIGSAAGPHPAATIVNTIFFPLGLARIKSPAASMLPGHLIATTWPGGHWIALSLLVCAALSVGASLIIRPPEDECAAGWRLVLGLTLMFGLAPATRVGYFVYPLGLSAWLLLAGRGNRRLLRALDRIYQGLSRRPGAACLAGDTARRPAPRRRSASTARAGQGPRPGAPPEAGTSPPGGTLSPPVRLSRPGTMSSRDYSTRR